MDSKGRDGMKKHKGDPTKKNPVTKIQQQGNSEPGKKTNEVRYLDLKAAVEARRHRGTMSTPKSRSSAEHGIKKPLVNRQRNPLRPIT
jgi:hypothetical protein